jgi:hypothetical protein
MTMAKPNPPAFDPLDVPESNQSRYPEQYRAAHLLRPQTAGSAITPG